MLQQLYIQNIAVIQKAAIDFKRGLNVFTGETGAGKTILISAIDAVLGERTSRDIIRSGEEKAFVSALFEDISTKARKKLSELGFEDDDGAVLITREITQAGKSVCKIGGMPATSALLKEISSLLIHIHGQRDASQLLLSENHIEMLDMFGGLSVELEKYKSAYMRMRKIGERLDSLKLDDSQKAQRIDMLTYQIREIEAAGFSDEDEEERLQSRKEIIRNAEKIARGLREAYEALAGGGDNSGIEDLFSELERGVNVAAQYIEPLEQMSERISEISYELADFSSEIRSYLDDIEYDPRELDQIESRLDKIYGLKRKYGSTIAEIVAFGRKAADELEELSTGEERAKRFEEEYKAAKGEALELARILSQKRLDAGGKFTSRIEAELAFLDMPMVGISLSHSEKQMAANGADEIEFMIATNVGEPPKPLSKIASGGEMARIMLAIKNVLADRDDIDTLIFDEVDTGVSGRAAQKIGRKLKQAASTRQVISVTHLAQVAAYADHHLLIHKQIEDGRTYTKVTPLDKQGVIGELARITGGELITELSLKSATELWEHSQGDIIE